MRSLRALKREDGASRYVFMTERGAPMTAAGFRKMLSRLGDTVLEAPHLETMGEVDLIPRQGA